MTSQHTPLDPARMSANAQRALGAGPARMMAARGLMPLPPADQLAVLYQLAIDDETTIAQAARTTAAGLPDKLLAGTLADASLDPRVIDFFGQMAGTKAGVFEAIVLNPSTGDETIADLAEKVGSREIDQIAQNEQRLLRHPEIIGAMYMNRHARMSTIDRVVELAVRNNVRVPGLAAWDEVARALSGEVEQGVDDATFAAVTAAVSGDDSELTTGDANQVIDEDALDLTEDAEKELPIAQMSIPHKIRLAQLGNAFARATLIRDPVKLVSMAAIKSPGVTDMEAARYASNNSMSEDIIRYIAKRGDWTKLYGIRVALCKNPKTPVAEVSRLLPFLREKDLEKIAKSRGVASAVVAQAKRLQMQRRGNK